MFNNWKVSHAIQPHFLYKEPAKGFSVIEEQDITCSFLSSSEFAQMLIYQPKVGSSKPVLAILASQRKQTDGGGYLYDDEFRDGLGEAAYIYVSEMEVPNPTYGDAFLESGKRWIIQQTTRMGRMWKVSTKGSEKADLI